MFIAKVSKERTIREFINGALMAPVVFIIFVGTDFSKERDGARHGLCCLKPNHFLVADLDKLSARRNLDTIISSLNYSWMCQNHPCHECASETLDRLKSYNYTGKEHIKFYKDMGDDVASVATDRRAVRLSCSAIEQMRFDVMLTQKGIGIFLSVISMLGIALYFVTSSDSGSIVIDCMTASEDPHPPAIRKVFWAVACSNSGCPPGSWWNGQPL